jgi:hypothetical protein
MKAFSCDCKRCDGSGEIVCPDCGGQGSFPQSIETAKLDKDMPHFAELVELQKDAWRVRAQCEELQFLNPTGSVRYTEQLNGALATIEGQAAKVKGKK